MNDRGAAARQSSREPIGDVAATDEHHTNSCAFQQRQMLEPVAVDRIDHWRIPPDRQRRELAIAGVESREDERVRKINKSSFASLGQRKPFDNLRLALK